MITRIKGKDITNFYSVKTNKTTKAVSDNELKTIYTARPELVKEAKVEWEEICNFEGDLYFNQHHGFFNFGNKIHISEDEEVSVDKTIFRADLNEKHAFTNKILKEQDDEKSKSDAEAIFKEEVANFNEAMIESNDVMLTYCKLHKLDPRDTDCFELFKLVYPGATYNIVDGMMKEFDFSIYNTTKATALSYDDIATPSVLSALKSSVSCLNGTAITVKA